MRYITIKRKRGNLFAAWVSYWCVFDFPIEKMPPPCAKEIDCIDCEDADASYIIKTSGGIVKAGIQVLLKYRQKHV